MKKLFYLKVVIIAAILSLKINAKSWLSVQGNQIVDGNGRPVILKGINIPDPEHLDTKPWERPGYSREKVVAKALSMGSKVIRVPIHPEGDGITGYFTHPEKYIKNYLLPTVKQITDAGVYAIVDLHYVSEFPKKKEKTIKFWNRVAPLFADNPLVIFDMFNEPTFPNDWNLWSDSFAKPVVKIIRSHAPRNIILVPGTYWAFNFKGLETNPINEKNIVYSIHIYPNAVQKNKKWLEVLNPLLKKYPFFVGEWGYSGTTKEVSTHGTTGDFGVPLLSWMTKEKLSWAAYVLDFKWDPPMIYRNGVLRGGNFGMGELVQLGLLY